MQINFYNYLTIQQKMRNKMHNQYIMCLYRGCVSRIYKVLIDQNESFFDMDIDARLKDLLLFDVTTHGNTRV